MSGFSIIKRATFLIPTIEARSSHHLFIVITNKCTLGNHLLIPICTKHRGCDQSCLLGKGDHDSFIVHDSYVCYARADLYNHEELRKKVKAGDIRYKDMLDERIFGFVCNGVITSKFTPPKMKKYYNENCRN